MKVSLQGHTVKLILAGTRPLVVIGTAVSTQAGNIKRTDQVNLDTHLYQILSFSRVCGIQTGH
jgi:hypothetical protein